MTAFPSMQLQRSTKRPICQEMGKSAQAQAKQVGCCGNGDCGGSDLGDTCEDWQEEKYKTQLIIFPGLP